MNGMSQYKYNSSDLIKMSMDQLTDRERFLLTESRTFCMYPWIHLHAYPTGEAYPCCHAEMGVGQIGNCRNNSLSEIWNSDAQRQLRSDMLTETENPACGRCYEQEKSGFFSGRQSANKHHGHNIARVHDTRADGHVDQFEMTYWDIRFSNLCNLRCRSCGHIFSSQWYQDQAKLAGGDWAKNHTVLNIAGRSETDVWEQLQPHLDYVEQIYFAGGEPLMMEEHYLILEELERRGRFDVRLIYNTNFTQVKLKHRTVFDYWRKFKSVAVGASLDAAGARGEYIRKGTDWAQVEANRRQMLEECPGVDFYISPTLSILNAMHLPDFHRDWVEKGLLRPQDLNVNILQDPAYFRIDIAPPEYKQRIQDRLEQHLAWLRPQDQLNRATVGFESAITFMNATDNTALIPKFWHKTHELDAIRRENILDVIPEIEALK
jgi:radical SAM protein with 4Fe4S-binding SPASM domain